MFNPTSQQQREQQSLFDQLYDLQCKGFIPDIIIADPSVFINYLHLCFFQEKLFVLESALRNIFHLSKTDKLAAITASKLSERILSSPQSLFVLKDVKNVNDSLFQKPFDSYSPTTLAHVACACEQIRSYELMESSRNILIFTHSNPMLKLVREQKHPCLKVVFLGDPCWHS